METELKGLKLYSVGEVAEIFNLNYKCIHNFMLEGRLKYIPIGKKGKKIPRFELFRFIKEEQQQLEPNPHLNKSSKDILNDILGVEEEKIDSEAIFNELFNQ